MLRDVKDSGQVYEPKTVKTSFTIDCNSRFAYLFAIDLAANDFIWLDVDRASSAAVAGTTRLGFLTEYFDMTSIKQCRRIRERVRRHAERKARKKERELVARLNIETNSVDFMGWR